MPRARDRAATLVVLAALAGGFLAQASPARALTASQQIGSSLDPEEDTRHPARLTLAMVLNEDHPRGATVCVGYSHPRSSRPNRGRVEASMRVFRSDRLAPGGTLVLELDFGRMKVRGGQTVECRSIAKPLEDGDGIEFEFGFQGRPPIRAAGGESAGVTASVRRE